MAHEFVVLRNGLEERYTAYEDIPLDFDHLIKFLPEVPPPPHTAEQHEEIDMWMEKFKKLLEIEKNNALICSKRSTAS
jgi:hypothetical protein